MPSHFTRIYIFGRKYEKPNTFVSSLYYIPQYLLMCHPPPPLGLYTFRKFNWWVYCFMYVTKYSTISLYLTKLYVTKNFAIASSVKNTMKSAKTFLTVYYGAAQRPTAMCILFLQLYSTFCITKHSQCATILLLWVHCRDLWELIVRISKTK